MSSINMVALRKHPFGTGDRDAGEQYTATPDESAILIALGWAEKAKEKSVEKPVTLVEKVIEAPAVKALKAEPAEGKRSYQRRDMKAKD